MVPGSYTNLELRCLLLEEKIQSCRTRSKAPLKDFLTSVLEKTRQYAEQEVGRRLERRAELSKAVASMKEKNNEETGNRVDFFGQLSDEVLEMILDNLKDPKHLINACRSSTTFHRILTPTKPVWLFNEVVPHLAKYLEVEDIRNCRPVCSAWKRSVDGFLENAPFDPAATEMYKSALDKRSLLTKLDDSRVTVSTRAEISRLSNQLSDGEDYLSQNPFVGRRVTLDQEEYAEGGVFLVADLERELRESEGYREQANEFLEKYGKHIWNCQFRSFNHVYHQCCFVQAVKNRLLNLPNLKGLELGPDNPFQNNPLTATDLRRITRKLEECSFPELPNLVSIKLNSTSTGLSRFLFEKYASQLHTLHLATWDFENGIMTNNDLITTGLPNLRELKVIAIYQPGWRGWNDCSRLLLLKSPLKTLVFDSHNCYLFPSLLAILPNFEETLEHLHVDFHSAGWFRKIQLRKAKSNVNTYLRSLQSLWLPNVQSVDLHNHLGSLNFLLCLPSLKSLSLSRFSESKKEVLDHEVLDILDWRGCWYESNMWTLLPSLMEYRYFLLKGQVMHNYCTREQYDKLKEAKSD